MWLDSIQLDPIRNKEALPYLITAIYSVIRAYNFLWKRRWESARGIKKNRCHSNMIINYLIVNSNKKKGNQRNATIFWAQKHIKSQWRHLYKSTWMSAKSLVIDHWLPSILLLHQPFFFYLLFQCGRFCVWNVLMNVKRGGRNYSHQLRLLNWLNMKSFICEWMFIQRGPDWIKRFN